MTDGLIESGIPWIGKYPKDWRLTKLRNVAVLNPSKGTIEDNELVSIVPMECVSEKGELTIDRLETFREVDKGLNNFKIGDVLFAKITPCMENGKGGLVKELPTINAFGSTEFFVFRPNKKVAGKYLYYSTYNRPFRKLAEVNMKGAAGQQRVPSKFLVTTKFPLPTKPEQEAIARHLDKVTAQIDNAIAIKEQQVEKLEKIRLSLINEVIKNGTDKFVKFKQVSREPITLVPEHYKVVKLKSVTHQIVDGTHFTPNYLDGDTSQGVPFLRITDLQNKDIDLTNTKYISEEEHKELSKRCLPEKGDLLLSKNGTIGLTKIVDWDYECSLFVSICLIKPIKRLIDVEYLNYYFQSDYMAYQFFHESKQITVTNLHLENIRDFLIVLPPLNEQRELAQILREKEEQFTNLRDKLNQQIDVLQAYRRSVIHEYVTGKKRVDMTTFLYEQTTP